MTNNSSIIFSASWSAIRPTLNCVNNTDAKDLDSPKDGFGHKYNMNLNKNIVWNDDIGPVAEHESLPANSDLVLHDRVNRVDVVTFYDDWTSDLLAIDCKQAIPYFQALR